MIDKQSSCGGMGCRTGDLTSTFHCVTCDMYMCMLILLFKTHALLSGSIMLKISWRSTNKSLRAKNQVSTFSLRLVTSLAWCACEVNNFAVIYCRTAHVTYVADIFVVSTLKLVLATLAITCWRFSALHDHLLTILSSSRSPVYDSQHDHLLTILSTSRSPVYDFHNVSLRIDAVGNTAADDG